MHKLVEYICDELEELEKKAEKGKLSMAEVEYADKLAHLKKNILKADELMDQGFSGDSYKDGGGYAMEGGSSYARGRGSNARRDSRGRYSSARGNYSRYAREGYARDGYSMDNRELAQELRELMEEAPDDRTRQEFQRFITKVEQM